MGNITERNHTRPNVSKQLDLVFQSYSFSFVSSLLISSTVAVMLWPMVPHQPLLLWLLSLFAVMAARLSIVRRYLMRQSGENHSRWRALFVAGAAAAGGCWGVSVIAFAASPADPVTMPLLIVIAGVCAYASVAMAALPEANAAFLLCALLPSASWLISFGARTDLFMGVIVLSYLVLMLMFARQMNRVALRSISLTEQNSKLNSALSQVQALEYATAQMIIDKSYAELFASLEDNIMFVDVKDSGEFLVASINPAAERCFGLNCGEVRGKSKRDLFPQDLAERLEAYDRLCVDTGEMVHYQEVLDRPSGARYYSVTHIPMKDDTGRIFRIAAISRDITERIQAEAQLQRREAQFRTLAENAPDPIYRYDRACCMTYVNPAVERLTGKPAAMLLGKPPTEVLLIPAVDGLLQCIQTVLHTGQQQERLVSFVAADDREVTIHNILVPERSSDGYVDSVLCIGRDITARRRMEDILQRSERELRLLSDSSPGMMGSIYVRPDGSFCMPYVSPNIEKLFGLRPQDVSEDASPLMALSLPEDAQRIRETIAESARCMTPWHQEYRIVHPVLGERWMEIHSNPELHPDGGIIWYGHIHDVTERKHTELALQAREREYRTLLEHTPDVIVRYDRDCRRIYVNPEWARVNGMPVHEALGKTPQQLSVRVKPVAADYQQKLRDVMESGQSATIDLNWLNEAGEVVCYAMWMIPERDGHDEVCSVLTVARDISERRRIEDALCIKEHESRTLIENSPDNISRYDRNCRRIYVNPSYGEMVDGGTLALLGKRPSEYPGGDNAEQYEEKIREVFENGANAEFELKWHDKLGNEICSHVRLAPERDKDGQIVSVLTVGRDITELNEHRKRIYQMAFYDSLTKLPNRALFNDRLCQILTDATLHEQLAGVMLLDLDRFKSVNDTLGHPSGDVLLCEAALRLSYCVRGYDTVARLGGDEFAILLPEIRSADDLGRIAAKILKSFNEPFVLDGKEVFITSSIGISVYPSDSLDADDLLKQADSAMYFAKRSGRNNFRFYASGMTVSANERLTLEGELRRGFGRGELELYYQPKVRLDDEKVIGSEALLRWIHPERGMVPPDKFISIAEECGLIVEIGLWVLRNACEVACAWNSGGSSNKVAINLSARQFQSNDLVKTVSSVLAETGCDPAWIELEITESLLLDEAGDVLSTLSAFREMGISIAIDDFGTGYSSLSYLAKFPIDTLKIDRSFTSRITENGHHAELVKAIISIAKCLDQQVVAEGAETSAEVSLLRSYGCDLVQGYFYGKPMSRPAYEEFYNSRRYG